jgi:hypothetical protein
VVTFNNPLAYSQSQSHSFRLRCNERIKNGFQFAWIDAGSGVLHVDDHRRILMSVRLYQDLTLSIGRCLQRLDRILDNIDDNFSQLPFVALNRWDFRNT